MPVGITTVLIFGAGIALLLFWYADLRENVAHAGELEVGLAQ
jgi:hypothetical protein